MSDDDFLTTTETSDVTTPCPACGGQIGLLAKWCPHCGRPMGERSFFFYAFWVALSLIVVALLVWMGYVAFLTVNRML
jgi:predicted amidophosphoribosyltransferase